MRLIVHTAAATIAGMFLVGVVSAAPRDGKWNGDLRCDALPPNPANLKAFSNPISMVVADGAATMTRSTALVVESLFGKIAKGGAASFSGNGKYNDSAKGGAWVTKIDGKFSGDTFRGAGAIYREDGTKIRDCSVELARAATQPQQTSQKAEAKPVVVATKPTQAGEAKAAAPSVNPRIQLACPLDWSVLSDIDGPNADKVILGVKARDWKKEYLDLMLSKEEECLRSRSDPDSVKKAILNDLQKRAYPYAVMSIERRDRTYREEMARAQQLVEARNRQMELQLQEKVRSQQAAEEDTRRILARRQKEQQEEREKAIATQRGIEEGKKAEASCNAAFTRAKFPDALRAAFYLGDINSPTPLPKFVCMAMSNGAQVTYLPGGAFSKEGFEVKSKKRAVQVFIEAQRIPGGDPKIPLMVPVSAKIDGEKVAITRENFRAFMAELIAVILDR